MEEKYNYDKTEENLWAIGRRIAEARVAKCMKSVDLANEVKVTKDFMSRVENGKVRFSDDFLRKVAKNLDVTVDYLINGDKMCLYINKIETLVKKQTDYPMIETAIEVLEAIFKPRDDRESR